MINISSCIIEETESLICKVAAYKEHFREPFGLSNVKLGSPSHGYSNPEIVADVVTV